MANFCPGCYLAAKGVLPLVNTRWGAKTFIWTLKKLCIRFKQGVANNFENSRIFVRIREIWDGVPTPDSSFSTTTYALAQLISFGKNF